MEKKITRTKIEYFTNCPGCGAPREEGKDSCPYCGRSMIKNKEVVEESQIDHPERYTRNGFSLTAIVLLFIVGIVHTGIAYVLYFGSMDGLKVQTIAILGYIDPVSALFFSALLLHERLSLTGILGAFMIILSSIALFFVEEESG